MKIALTGVSGFLGGALVSRLKEEGHELTVLGRRDPKAGKFFSWDSLKDPVPMEAIEGRDAVIHLSGEPVAQRWSAEAKRNIADSRTRGTNAVVQAISTASKRPQVLISASAIGFYGDRGEEVLTEASQAGSGFLPEVCVEWEKSALAAKVAGVRVVCPRIGIVLHQAGGALAEMLTPFRLGVGGPMGSGDQWMSWIHRDDLISMILWSLKTDTVSGPVNGVAPQPCRNREFAKALGKELSRPAVLPVPAFALKLLFGEMAGVILSSQHVLPATPTELGFQFQYPQLAQALHAAVS